MTLAKGSSFRDGYLSLISETVVSEDLRRRFSRALGVEKMNLMPRLFEVSWEGDHPPQPRFNVMSYIGLSWLAIILDPYPSGSILEAEFTRHAGVPTAFVRLGSANCFVGLYRRTCAEDVVVLPTTEMLYTFTGTTYITVVMSALLALYLALGEELLTYSQRLGTDADELMKRIKKEKCGFMKMMMEALSELANQYGRRTDVYKCLRGFKRNWFKLEIPYKRVLDLDVLLEVARFALEG